MGRALATTPFAEWLRGEIDKRDGWGIRTLARHMNPRDPEVARRALNRYLYEGAEPSGAYRVLIAEALGVAESGMPDAPFRSGEAA